MSEQVPDPETARQRFADRLEVAGVPSRRLIDVVDGEKRSWTDGHQQAINWMDADDDGLSGNYGVHPGYGLIEFDVDDYDDEHDTDVLDALPPTFTVKSPHTAADDPGHRYYAVDDDDIREVLQDIAETLNPEPSWGEIKYEGKYVVGPGSQLDGCDKEWCDECAKSDGGYYWIAEDRPIATLSADDLAEVLRADPEIGDDESEQRPASEVFDLPPEEEEREERESDEWMTEELAEEALSEISPDVDYPEWAAIGFALSNHFGEGTGGRLFRGWSRGGSKWDSKADKQADRIINDAGKYPHGISAFVRRAKEHGWDASAAARKTTADTRLTESATDGGTAVTTTDTEHGTAGGWDEVRMLFDSNERGSTTRGYNTAADLLGERHSFATIRDTDELYFYDPTRGFYVRKGRSFIDELLEEHIPDRMNTGRRKNIFEKLRARNYVDAGEFSPPEGKVCVKNGVLDLDTRELEPHSSEYYFTSRLQTPYIEGGEANRWEEFIAESTTTDEAQKLEEFIGYCLEMWHHDREKNLFIVGPRQSGKSTFTDTVQALFGDMPTVTHLTPQQIADTRFGAANLKDAALNSVNDINATKIEDTGTLKRAFSGEGMKFERKGQDEEFGEPNAKHLYSANWLPTVVGQDESLFRRVLIVEFPNKVDDDERDRELKPKLQGELPGILRRALDARDRLHEQGGFTNDRSTDDTRRTWDAWLDAHKRFLYTQFRITGDSADTVDKETYYQAYKEYAGRKGYQLKPKQGVTKSLQWVPEISVGDDEYAGLVWDGGDAADDGGEISTPTAQDELTTRVLGWVEAFATPTTPAQRGEILEHAESKGEDPERVTHVIDNLCDAGALWKPRDGGLRPS